MESPQDIDQLAINTIRMLVVDAVQKANSGHPGTPMDAAPAAYTLWQRVLRYDPADPDWLNRDRFVLSSGHASMLLYSLIHLSGVKAVNPSYEQVGRDPSHWTTSERSAKPAAGVRAIPSIGWTSGVETTTGPLGQGVATSVGMAIARQLAARHLQPPGFRSVRFQCLRAVRRRRHDGGRRQRGSIPGRSSRLSNLCWIYDSNRVTIEGHTDIAFTEDVAARFLAYGWNVLQGDRRQRYGAPRAGLSRLPAHPRSTHAHRRAQSYRLRRASQAGLARSPRRAARRWKK